MANVTEIAPDVFRISIYAAPFDLQFNHFLIRDDEPLLHHAGMNGMFPELKDAVAKIVEETKLPRKRIYKLALDLKSAQEE